MSEQPLNLDICVGRETLCEDVVATAWRKRCVLLFGGRQAGKTTVLLRIAERLGEQTGNVREADSLEVGVYVDLMRLPHDATPADFYRLLAERAMDACRRQVDGFALASLPVGVQADGLLVEGFMENLAAVQAACGDASVEFVFLLDEAKRVLGERFPRGFQDNLFALMYGADEARAVPLAFVFAGAQNLYRFCEDDTSAIGTRAAQRVLPPLSEEAVAELCTRVLPDGSPEEAGRRAAWVKEVSGGHAGLARRCCEALRESGGNAPEGEEHGQQLLAELRASCAGLFRLWLLSMSEEARCVAEGLSLNLQFALKGLAQTLHDGGYDRFEAEKTRDELQFVGVADVEGGILRRVGELFWSYYAEFSVDSLGNAAEREVWASIERAELRLRELIAKEYEDLWPGQLESRVRKMLGSDAWAQVERNRQTARQAYKYSPARPERNVMDCLYLGQCGMLMTNNAAWVSFKGHFRDKRHLDDLIAAIIPVRNDRAHFVKVPPKELERCRIACDDLIVILGGVAE